MINRPSYYKARSRVLINPHPKLGLKEHQALSSYEPIYSVLYPYANFTDDMHRAWAGKGW